jgi:hypothetical protein
MILVLPNIYSFFSKSAFFFRSPNEPNVTSSPSQLILNSPPNVPVQPRHNSKVNPQHTSRVTALCQLSYELELNAVTFIC